MKRGMGTTLLAGGVILGALQFAAPWVQGAELTQQLKPIKNYYLGDADEIARRAAAVAAQGKAK